jgi:hypothetical protein
MGAFVIFDLTFLTTVIAIQCPEICDIWQEWSLGWAFFCGQNLEARVLGVEDRLTLGPVLKDSRSHQCRSSQKGNDP